MAVLNGANLGEPRVRKEGVNRVKYVLYTSYIRNETL